MSNRNERRDKVAQIKQSQREHALDSLRKDGPKHGKGGVHQERTKKHPRIEDTLDDDYDQE